MTTKTLTMVTLSMLFATAWVGCSKNDPSVVTPTDPLAIRLNAGMAVISKSAVNNGSTFTAAIAGWESLDAANYGIERTWQTTSSIIAADAASDITLADLQHYSQNRAVKTYIKSWYPAGVLASDGVVTFGGVADGTVDVLLANEVSGSAQDPTGKILRFNHPLTQLKFAIQGDASFGATIPIKSITVQNAGVPTGIDLKTDAVSYTTTDLIVPEIDGMQVITTSKTIIGKPIMIRPITGSTFLIDIETSEAIYLNVRITVTDDNLNPGKAYTITLNFAGVGITTQASVTQWDDTGVGSGDISTD